VRFIRTVLIVGNFRDGSTTMPTLFSHSGGWILTAGNSTDITSNQFVCQHNDWSTIYTGYFDWEKAGKECHVGVWASVVGLYKASGDLMLRYFGVTTT
jgi:hypothetical protein